MAIANIDAAALDFHRTDKHRTGTYFIGVQVRIGLHPVERFQRHAIRVTRPDQEVAKVSRVVRVGQTSAGCCADVADKRAQASQRTGNGVWLKEEDGMLACIWRESCHLTGSLRKI